MIQGIPPPCRWHSALALYLAQDRCNDDRRDSGRSDSGSYKNADLLFSLKIAFALGTVHRMIEELKEVLFGEPIIDSRSDALIEFFTVHWRAFIGGKGYFLHPS